MLHAIFHYTTRFQICQIKMRKAGPRSRTRRKKCNGSRFILPPLEWNRIVLARILRTYTVFAFITRDLTGKAIIMNTKHTWKLLVLGMIFNTLTGDTPLAWGDDIPTLSGGHRSGLDVMVEALTPTDVHIGEDVEFEVTVRNSTEGWRRTWLWFTVKLEGEIHEKILRDPYLDKGRSFHGLIPPHGEVIQRFRARPLDEIQVGFYTLTAKIGPEVIPFDQEWVSAMDSFNGHILPSKASTRSPSGGQDGRWTIERIDAITEVANPFQEKNVEPARAVARIVQNSPNPFNPSTSITFEVESADERSVAVRLTVYDIHGRLIRTLFNGSKTAGRYTVSWDGRDEQGIPVDSGIYLFRLRSGANISLKKGILTK